MSGNKNKFKIIGLCYSGISDEYQLPLINYLMEKCVASGFKLLIFASFSNKEPNSGHDNCEYNIYSLINYDILDGMILLSPTFKSQEILNNIIDSSRNANIPIVSIDSFIENGINIEFDYIDALYKLTTHFIKNHNCSKINFLSGGFENEYNDKRLHAYKKALIDNNIPYEENRVIEGRFWHENATQNVIEYLKSHPAPDAFVCSNDSMAIGTILALETCGYRVPDDVLVSGFDGITEAINHTPKITTAQYDFECAADFAVKSLINYFNGIENPASQICPATIIFSESCGCVPAEYSNYNVKQQRLYSTIYDIQRYSKHMIKITSDITRCGTIEEAALTLARYSKNAWTHSLWVCLCNNLLEKHDNYDEYDSTIYDEIDSYPENMNLFVYKDGDKSSCLLGDFKTKDLIPNLYEVLEQHNSIHFMPLNNINQTTGYMAREIAPYPNQAFEKWHSFCMNVSSAISSLNTKTKLKYAINMLEKIYNRDPLTNLFNRRGFFQKVEKYFSDKVPKDIIIFSIDLDNLKPVNDKYGHDMGDHVLVNFSYTLQAISSQDEICSRFGGDEFVVAIDAESVINPTEYIKAYTKKLSDNLKKFNDDNPLPYEISASIGSAIEKCSDLSDIEKLISVADQKMYSNKATKKKIKNNVLD